jgi:hypothetical protein
MSEQQPAETLLDRMLTSEKVWQGSIAVGLFSAQALLASMVEIAGDGIAAALKHFEGSEG